MQKERLGLKVAKLMFKDWFFGFLLWCVLVVFFYGLGEVLQALFSNLTIDPILWVVSAISAY